MIERAKEIAQSVHGPLKDKKHYPYMSHIIDVAKRVSHLGEKYEVVAWLHDAIEDAEPVDFKKKVTAQIEVGFDEEIVLAVKAMSKNPGEDYFADYLPRLKLNSIATQVKIADASHNLSKAHLLNQIDEIPLQEELRSKYIKVLDELGVDGKSCEKPLEHKDGKWLIKE
jgi:(p)ppGpp synthase/HD superfamily hydrolase